jgi:hypothetical protein
MKALMRFCRGGPLVGRDMFFKATRGHSLPEGVSILSELLDRFGSASFSQLLQIQKLIVKFSTPSAAELSGHDGTPVTAPRSSR